MTNLLTVSLLDELRYLLIPFKQSAVFVELLPLLQFGAAFVVWPATVLCGQVLVVFDADFVEAFVTLLLQFDELLAVFITLATWEFVQFVLLAKASAVVVTVSVLLGTALVFTLLANAPAVPVMRIHAISAIIFVFM